MDLVVFYRAVEGVGADEGASSRKHKIRRSGESFASTEKGSKDHDGTCDETGQEHHPETDNDDWFWVIAR